MKIISLLCLVIFLNAAFAADAQLRHKTKKVAKAHSAHNLAAKKHVTAKKKQAASHKKKIQRNKSHLKNGSVKNHSLHVAANHSKHVGKAKRSHSKGAPGAPAIKNIQEISQCLVGAEASIFESQIQQFAQFKYLPQMFKMIQKQLIPLIVKLETFSKKLDMQGLVAKNAQDTSAVQNECQTISNSRKVPVNVCIQKFLQDNSDTNKVLDAKEMQNALLKPLLHLNEIQKGKSQSSFLEFEANISNFMAEIDYYLVKLVIYQKSFAKVKDPSVRKMVILGKKVSLKLGKMVNALYSAVGSLQNINHSQALSCPQAQFLAALSGKIMASNHMNNNMQPMNYNGFGGNSGQLSGANNYSNNSQGMPYSQNAYTGMQSPTSNAGYAANGGYVGQNQWQNAYQQPAYNSGPQSPNAWGATPVNAYQSPDYSHDQQSILQNNSGSTVVPLGYSNPSGGQSSAATQNNGSMPGYSASSTQNNGSMPGYSAGSTQNNGSMPGYSASSTQNNGSVPGYGAGSMQNNGSMPGYSAGSMQNNGSMPGYSAGSMQNNGSMPGYSAGSTQNNGSVPGYSASSTQNNGSVPGYSASSTQNSGMPIGYSEDIKPQHNAAYTPSMVHDFETSTQHYGSNESLFSADRSLAERHFERDEMPQKPNAFYSQQSINHPDSYGYNYAQSLLGNFYSQQPSMPAFNPVYPQSTVPQMQMSQAYAGTLPSYFAGANAALMQPAVNASGVQDDGYETIMMPVQVNGNEVTTPDGQLLSQNNPQTVVAQQNTAVVNQNNNSVATTDSAVNQQFLAQELQNVGQSLQKTENELEETADSLTKAVVRAEKAANRAEKAADKVSYGSSLGESKKKNLMPHSKAHPQDNRHQAQQQR